MKIEAYYHRSTGQLFKEKEEFKAHLCLYNFRVRTERKRKVRMDKIKKDINELVAKYGTVVDILNFVSDNFSDLVEYTRYEKSNQCYSITTRKKWRKIARSLRVTYASAGGFKKPRLINGRKMGWHGSIHIKVNHREMYPASVSEILGLIGIKINSGGSRGDYGYEYECFFYEENWPMLDIMARLRDGNALNNEIIEKEEEGTEF